MWMLSTGRPSPANAGHMENKFELKLFSPFFLSSHCGIEEKEYGTQNEEADIFPFPKYFYAYTRIFRHSGEDMDIQVFKD